MNLVFSLPCKISISSWFCFKSFIVECILVRFLFAMCIRLFNVDFELNVLRIGSFCTPSSVCHIIAFDRLVLYGNVALSVAVVVRSTKNGTPFFPKKFSFFGKLV